MHLHSDEEVLRIIKRHKTPYVLKVLMILSIAMPLYFILILIQRAAGTNWIILGFAVISFFLGVIIALVSLDYLLDKLVITNKRIVWVNWKSLFKREEHEVELSDVQDIEIRERGIISKIPYFNYGLLVVETAASKTAITFQDCPNPEQINHFLIAQTQKVKTPTP